MRATSQLRQLLKSGQTLFVPGCYNALSARIVAEVGFPALYMTGYGTSLSLLGLPDAGLATMTEMHLNARYIANAVTVPVIAGRGQRLRQRHQRDAHGARVHRHGRGGDPHRGPGDSQALRPRGRAPRDPDRGGGRQVPGGRCRTARARPDFVLIARTDARGASGGSLDDAISRANAYLEAGADLAFVEGRRASRKSAASAAR